MPPSVTLFYTDGHQGLLIKFLIKKLIETFLRVEVVLVVVEVANQKSFLGYVYCTEQLRQHKPIEIVLSESRVHPRFVKGDCQKFRIINKCPVNKICHQYLTLINKYI